MPERIDLSGLRRMQAERDAQKQPQVSGPVMPGQVEMHLRQQLMSMPSPTAWHVDTIVENATGQQWLKITLCNPTAMFDLWLQPDMAMKFGGSLVIAAKMMKSKLVLSEQTQREMLIAMIGEDLTDEAEGGE